MKYRISEIKFEKESLFMPQFFDDGKWHNMNLGPFLLIEQAKAIIDNAINPPKIKFQEIIHNYP